MQSRHRVHQRNAHLSSSINATTFCAQTGNNVAQTTCSRGSLTEAKPTATVGRYTISVHYPVPAAEIYDPNVVGGAHLNDGTACQRMRVIISATDQRMFGGVFGAGTLGTARSATVRPSIRARRTPPRCGCWIRPAAPRSPSAAAHNSPSGPPPSSGRDRHRRLRRLDLLEQPRHHLGQRCRHHTHRHTDERRLQQGSVELLALPVGMTTCIDPACNATDVTGGRLTPNPSPKAHAPPRSASTGATTARPVIRSITAIVISDCPYRQRPPPHTSTCSAPRSARQAAPPMRRPINAGPPPQLQPSRDHHRRRQLVDRLPRRTSTSATAPTSPSPAATSSSTAASQ